MNWKSFPYSLMNLSNMMVAVRQPRLVLAFIRRKQLITRFTGCSQTQVNQKLKEADELCIILTNKLKSVCYVRSGSMLSPLRGSVLYTLIRIMKPSIVVETGVASGGSTSLILHALELNKKGTLYSIDLPNLDTDASIPKGKKVGWLVPEKLKHRWQLLIGSSIEKLPHLLTDLGQIDVFLHDSEHTYKNMMFEFECVWPHLKGHGLLLSDDARWNSAFSNFARRVKPSETIIFDGLGALLK